MTLRSVAPAPSGSATGCFLPALAIPFVTLALVLVLPYLKQANLDVFDTRQTTLVVLGSRA
jgi:uncharacterized membrane protein